MSATAAAETSTPPATVDHDPDLAEIVGRILAHGRRLGLGVTRVCVYLGISPPSLSKAKRGEPVALGTRRKLVEGDRIFAGAQSAADLRVPA